MNLLENGTFFGQACRFPIQSRRKVVLSKLFCKRAKPWIHNSGFSRRYIKVTINRIGSDHYNLAASFDNINIVSSWSCSCSDDIQNIEHVVWSCPLYIN